ncbi:DUF2274 domain-containing protein [Xanthobacter autotrophicus DSM 431]
MLGEPATVHRDLGAYTEIVARGGGDAVSLDLVKLTTPVLQRLM